MSHIRQEMKKLRELFESRRKSDNPVTADVLTHAMLLIGNDWSASDALEESERTLSDAEEEGQL